MSLNVVFVLAIAVCSVVPSLSTDVTPLQKVIEMLDGVLAKGNKEKHEEEVEFSKFQEWCEQVRDEKSKSIKEASDDIMQISADIDSAEAHAETLAAEIGELEKEVATLTADLESATAVRKKENADYKAAHFDLSESISAIERAVQVLKQREGDVPQSLLQVVNSKLIDDKSRAVLNSFLAIGVGSADGAPEANAYEFQSGGIVSLLGKLRLKFQDQRLALEKEEMTAKANYQVLAQQLTDDIKADKDSIEKKTALKARRLGDAANAKGDKATTEKSKESDESILSDTLAECRATSQDFENNQVTRAGEIKAIKQAIGILSSDAVTGHADKYLPAAALLQKAARGALAQLRSTSKEDEPQITHRVAEFLEARSKKLGSHYLALVAARAQEDPFSKVKKMIKDLIVKLMEEANSEADEHAYCQTELATNKQTREIKSSEVEELSAKLEEEESTLQKLASEITSLSDQVSEIKGQQAEATKLRIEEKRTNAATVADAKEAQAAVEAAIKVLKDFYAKASDLSLVQGQEAALRDQMKQAALPTYRGNQDTSTGIFGMLEVVLSDFARLESETSAAEDSQATSFQKMMDETNEDVAVKETEIAHKSKQKDTTEEAIRSLEKDLKLTQSELDKALDYYGKLKQQCVDTGLSYEERKRMREEEIVSLQEALKMLNGEDLA